jgi:hypothetical protein
MLTGIAMEGGRIVREQMGEERGKDIFRIRVIVTIAIAIVIVAVVAAGDAVIVDVCEGTMMVAGEGSKAGVKHGHICGGRRSAIGPRNDSRKKKDAR